MCVLITSFFSLHFLVGGLWTGKTQSGSCQFENVFHVCMCHIFIFLGIEIWQLKALVLLFVCVQYFTGIICILLQAMDGHQAEEEESHHLYRQTRKWTHGQCSTLKQNFCLSQISEKKKEKKKEDISVYKLVWVALLDFFFSFFLIMHTFVISFHLSCYFLVHCCLTGRVYRSCLGNSLPPVFCAPSCALFHLVPFF